MAEVSYAEQRKTDALFLTSIAGVREAISTIVNADIDGNGRVDGTEYGIAISKMTTTAFELFNTLITMIRQGKGSALKSTMKRLVITVTPINPPEEQNSNINT